MGTSLAVQWLGLRASTAGGMGLIPGRETKIPTCHVVWPKKKKPCLDGSGPGLYSNRAHYDRAECPHTTRPLKQLAGCPFPGLRTIRLVRPVHGDSRCWAGDVRELRGFAFWTLRPLL